MKFRHTEPDDQYFLKFLSEGGRWEFGLYRTLYGIRVMLGDSDHRCISVNYCAGNNPSFALQIMFAVAKILGDVPEEIQVSELEAMWPGFTIKPISKDLTCWPQLQAMAEKASAWDRNLDLELIECLDAIAAEPRLVDPMVMESRR